MQSAPSQGECLGGRAVSYRSGGSYFRRVFFPCLLKIEAVSDLMLISCEAAAFQRSVWRCLLNFRKFGALIPVGGFLIGGPSLSCISSHRRGDYIFVSLQGRESGVGSGVNVGLSNSLPVRAIFEQPLQTQTTPQKNKVSNEEGRQKLVRLERENERMEHNRGGKKKSKRYNKSTEGYKKKKK